MKISALLNQLKVCQAMRPAEIFGFQDVLKNQRVVRVSDPLRVGAVVLATFSVP